jgi:ATP-dependent DNA helicase RecG
LIVKGSYTAAEFASLVEHENDEIELKTGLGSDPLQEGMVALSNAAGGVIFVGVQNDGTIVGRKLDQPSEDRIHQAALDARDVGRYHIRPVEVAGKEIIAISVERRVEGFAQTSNGRILVRRGARNATVFGPDLTRFVNERSLRRFELTDTGLAASTADPARLQEVAEAYDLRPKARDLHQRLQERGLLSEQGTLTIAGALFLTDPSQALQQQKAMVEVRRYPSAEAEYDRREEFRGALHQQVADATQFIIDEIGSDVVVTGLYRHDLPRLPEVVIREAVSNAVAHRSYEAQGTATVVEIRPDRVVVTSPGRLPEPVTVDNLRQAQAARNQHVIHTLRRFRLAEDAGRGVDVMQDSMQEALLDPPKFEEIGGSVRVTLPLRGPITPRERAWVADLERRGEIRGPDRLILVHAARGEEMTNARARQVLRVGPLEAREALQRLRDSDLLIQHGTRGGATYAIVEEFAPPAAFRMTPQQIEELLMEEAAQRPLTNEIARELTGLSRRAVLVVLNRLVDDKRLRRVGAKRGTRYVARAARRPK